MKEVQQPNDILVATLQKPDASILELIQNDINITNTSLLSKDEYKNKPLIQKVCVDQEGNFDEAKFNALYDLAEQKYWALDDDNLVDEFSKYLEYSATSRYRRPKDKLQDTTYHPYVDKQNPLQQAVGLVGLNVKSDPKLTPEEAAQRGRIWDPETKSWLEETAESRPLWKKLFGDTLVYATYDTEGYQANPVTGEMGYHYKDEKITDENGQYFTEFLGNRELKSKQVVSVQDILTPEDSTLNKLDFFDSDGYTKSLGGTAMKIVASALPYMIPFGGFNTYYGAFTAITGLASVLPTFYKSMEGLFTFGNDTALTAPATRLENWFRKFKPGMSQHGRESLFSVEQVGNMLADVFGQLYQQRAAASLANFIYKVPKLKNADNALEFAKYKEDWDKINKAGKAFSLGYMALVSTADVYNDAIQNGYDKFTAGLAALASAGALFGIMNFNEGANGLGTWFLDATTGYNHEVTRAPITKAAKSLYKDIQGTVHDTLVGKGTKDPLSTIFSRFKLKTVNWLDDAFRVAGEDVWKNAVVEGVEEVSEEVVQDSIKGIIDTLSWLGFTPSKGSFGGWNNVFSKEGLARYAQTALGGAAGGAMFSVQNNVIEPWIQRTFIDANYKSPREAERDLEIIDAIYFGRTDELIDELKRCGKLLSTTRATTGFTDTKGNYHDVKAEDQQTQSDMVVSAAIEHVQTLDKFVKDMLKGTEMENLDRDYRMLIRPYFKELWAQTHAEEYILNRFKENLGQLKANFDTFNGSLKEDAKPITAEEAVSESEREETRAASERTKNFYKQQFFDQLKKVRNFWNAKEWYNSYSGASILSNPIMRGSLMGLDVESFYENILKESGGVQYKNLPPESTDPTVLTKEKVDKLHKIYADDILDPKNADFVAHVDSLVNVYDKLQELISPDIEAATTSLHKSFILKAAELTQNKLHTAQEAIENLTESELLTEEEIESWNDDEKAKAILERKEAKKSQLQKQMDEITKSDKSDNLVSYILANPNAFSLSDRSYINWAQKFTERGLFIYTGFNEEQINVLQDLINSEVASSRQIFFNKETIENLVKRINNRLGDRNNIYTQKIRELDTTPGDDSPIGIVELREDGNFEGLDLLVVKELQDYVRGDAYIEENLYNKIVNSLVKQITDRAEKYLQPLLNLEKINLGVLYDTLLELLQRVQTSLTTDNVDQLKSNLESILTNLYPRIDDLRDELINLGFGQKVVDADGTESIELTDETVEKQFNAQFNPLIQELENFAASSPTAVQNPFIKAIDKIHFGLNGTTEGATLAKYFLQKELNIVKGRGSADTTTFSEEELKNIDSAISTLQVLSAVVEGMIAQDPEQNRQYGINQLRLQYLHAYDPDSELIDRIKVIDPEDSVIAKTVINSTIHRLQDLKQVSSELMENKAEEYNKKGLEALKAKASFYKTRPKLDLPDDEKKELLDEDIANLDYDENNEASLLNYTLQCEQNICKNLQDLRVKLNESGEENTDQKIIDYILNTKQIKDTLTSEQIASTIYPWEAIVTDETGSVTINGLWWAKKLTGLLGATPKDVQKIINSIVETNERFYPRRDQLFALENILYAIKGRKNFNYLNSKVAEIYNASDDLWHKIVLDSTAILLGSGGSGKSYLASIIKYTESTDLEHILVSAKSSKKLNEFYDSIHSLNDAAQRKELYSICSDFEKYAKSFSAEETAFQSYIFSHGTKITKLNTTETIDGRTFKVSSSDGVATVEMEYKDGDTVVYTISATLTENEAQQSPVKLKISFNDDIFKETIEKNSLLVIDEVTQLSDFELQLINKIIQKTDGFVLYLGDLDQLGYVTKINREGRVDSYPGNLHHYLPNFINKLYGNWRLDNTAQKENIVALKLNLQKTSGIDRQLDLVDTAWNTTDVSNLLSRNSEVNFVYTTKGTDDKFMGVKLEADLSHFIPLINDKKYSVGVIVNPGENKAEVKRVLHDQGLEVDESDILTLEEIQGAEYDYVISYKITSSDDILTDSTEAYTIITRGRKGVLVVNTDTKDLFKNINLTNDYESDRVSKMSSPSDNSAQNYSEELTSIITSLPDLEIATLTKSVTRPEPEPPAPLTTEELTKITETEDGIIEEGTPPASPSSSPSSSSSSPSSPSNSDEWKRKSKQLTQRYRDQLGIENFFKLQSWYYMPGAPKDAINALVNGDKEAVTNFVNKYKNSPISLVYNYFESVKKKEGHLSISLDNMGSWTGEQLITNYKTYIGQLRTSLTNGTDSPTFLIEKRQYNPELDWALDKEEDNNIRHENITLISYQLPDPNDDAKYIYIPLGRIGYTLDDNEESSSKIISKLEVGQKKLYKFKNGYNNDNNLSNNGIFGRAVNRPVFMVTGGRYFKNTSKSESFLESIDSVNAKYKRKSLKVLLERLGFSLVQPDDWWKGEGTDAEFIDWYNRWRFDNLTPEGVDIMKRFSREQHILVTTPGSNIPIPIRLIKIIKSIENYYKTSASKNDSIWMGDNNNNKRTLGSYGTYKLLQGIFYKYKIEKSPGKYWTAQSFKQALLSSSNTGADAFLTGIKTKLEKEAGAPNDLLDVLDHYNNVLAVNKILSKDLASRTENEKKIVNEFYRNAKFTIEGENLSKSLEKILKFFDSNAGLPSFFFEKFPNALNNVIGNEKDYIVEFAYEPVDYIIDEAGLEEITASTSTGSMSSGGNDNNSKQSFQEMIDNLDSPLYAGIDDTNPTVKQAKIEFVQKLYNILQGSGTWERDKVEELLAAQDSSITNTDLLMQMALQNLAQNQGSINNIADLIFNLKRIPDFDVGLKENPFEKC